MVWGGLSGATPAEAVSWGKVNPGVLPDTVVAYCDSTIAFPLFCEYAVGSPNGRRPRKELVHKRDALVADLRAAGEGAPRETKPTVGRTSRPKSIGIADGNALVGAGAARRAQLVDRAADLRRRQRAERASSRTCATSLRWDVLFVLEHDDLRRARRRRITTGSRGSSAARSSPSIATISTIGGFRRTRAPGVIVLSAPDERWLRPS